MRLRDIFKHKHQWVPVGTYRALQPWMDPHSPYHDPIRSPAFFRNVIVYACGCGAVEER